MATVHVPTGVRQAPPTQTPTPAPQEIAEIEKTTEEPGNPMTFTGHKPITEEIAKKPKKAK